MKHFLKQIGQKIDCTSRNLPDFMCAISLFTLIYLLQQPGSALFTPFKLLQPQSSWYHTAESICTGGMTLPCKWSQWTDLTFCPPNQRKTSAVVRLLHKESSSAKVGSKAVFPTWTHLLQGGKKKSFVKEFHSYCLFWLPFETYKRQPRRSSQRNEILQMKDFSSVFILFSM